MKRLLPLVLLGAIFSGCSSYYERIIESDYSFSGKFSQYDTFDFMVNQEAGFDERNQALVEKFIGQRLRTLGFSQKEKKASILVSYKVYYDDFSMKGYAQPEFNQWAKSSEGADVLDVDDLPPANETELGKDYSDYFIVGPTTGYIPLNENEYAAVDCEMIEGSLLISFFDRKAKRTVWQGYASGVTKRIDEERFLRHTVAKILDDYRVLAKDFGVNN